jgi:phage tail-like protein
MFDYPYTGFSFTAVFEIFPQLPVDIAFQEISGLSVEMGMEPYTEGGQNRFIHQLPLRSQYTDITFKRAMSTASGILVWCRDAFENFKFQPTNVLISLLNEDAVPLFSWYVINAIPKKLEVSAFNAERSEIVIETLVLSYQYFSIINPSTAAADIAGAISSSL